MATQKHLFVLIHGLAGNPIHLACMKATLEQKFPENSTNVELFVPETNAGMLSLDGIRVGALRVLKELEEFILNKCNEGIVFTQLSIVGYSLGGLCARYLIGILNREGFLDQIQPMTFTTFATPHVGSTFLNKSLSTKVLNFLGSNVLGTSGRDLFGNGSTILEDMADPAQEYFQGLKKFKHLMLFANSVHDRTVPFFTAFITEKDPFQDQGLVDEVYFALPPKEPTPIEKKKGAKDIKDPKVLKDLQKSKKESSHSTTPSTSLSSLEPSGDSSGQRSSSNLSVHSKISSKSTKSTKSCESVKSIKSTGSFKSLKPKNSTASVVSPATTDSESDYINVPMFVNMKKSRFESSNAKAPLTSDERKFHAVTTFMLPLMFPIMLAVTTVSTLLSHYRVREFLATSEDWSFEHALEIYNKHHHVLKASEHTAKHTTEHTTEHTTSEITHDMSGQHRGLAELTSNAMDDVLVCSGEDRDANQDITVSTTDSPVEPIRGAGSEGLLDSTPKTLNIPKELHKIIENLNTLPWEKFTVRLQRMHSHAEIINRRNKPGQGSRVLAFWADYLATKFDAAL